MLEVGLRAIVESETDKFELNFVIELECVLSTAVALLGSKKIGEPVVVVAAP
jgi:hypothetical protein